MPLTVLENHEAKTTGAKPPVENHYGKNHSGKKLLKKPRGKLAAKTIREYNHPLGIHRYLFRELRNHLVR